MSVTPVRDTDIRNSVIQSELRLGHYTDTLAGNLTIPVTFPPLLVLDPGGAARTVTLPAEADSKGLMFIIVNAADAAETITVNNDAAASVADILQNERVVLVCDGTNWFGLVGANT